MNGFEAMAQLYDDVTQTLASGEKPNFAKTMRRWNAARRTSIFTRCSRFIVLMRRRCAIRFAEAQLDAFRPSGYQLSIQYCTVSVGVVASTLFCQKLEARSVFSRVLQLSAEFSFCK